MLKRKKVFENPECIVDVHFHPSRLRWVILSTKNGNVKIIDYHRNKVMK